MAFWAAGGMSVGLGGVADLVVPRVDRGFGDPASWVEGSFLWKKGQGPTAYQLEILSQLSDKHRVAVRGPRGLGKTCLSAWAVLWFALTRDAAGIDWKIPTTAGGWRQLAKFTWPEIHKWAKLLDWERLGRPKFRQTELMTLSLRLNHGEAFAAASDNPWLIEGAHADQLLFVFDEAKAIPDKTWDSAEGTFSGAGVAGVDAFALAISTPGEPVGRFYSIHRRGPGFENWQARHVTLDETIAAQRIAPDWAANMRSAWGPDSAMYANHVLGEFAASEEDGIIPLAWVEQAFRRWEKLHGSCEERVKDGVWRHVCDPGEFTCVGVDPARSGLDKSAFALRYGSQVLDVRLMGGQTTTEVAARSCGILEANGGKAVVDVIGIGAGVVDQMRDDRKFEKRVLAFNASNKTTWRDKSGEIGFVNTRAAAWWHLRELLDPSSENEIALPPSDGLLGDLTTPKWQLKAGGIQLESKDDIRKRLEGRSPDAGDAVVQAFWLDALFRPVVIAGPAAMGQSNYWRSGG